MTTPVERILSKLPDAKETATGQWSAHCPAHDDRHPSLSVSEGEDGRALVYCHAGCSHVEICEAVDLNVLDLMPTGDMLPTPGQPKANGKPRIAATYDYRDEDGKLLFQVVRHEPKDFRQRRPKPGGGWERKVNGVRKVPYRLPELLAAPAAPVFIVEGEKDADTLADVGVLATCNAGGAGKWTAEHAGFLKGRRVAVVPDNDEPGRSHAQQVAQSLDGIAESVRIVELPGLPNKGDVSDWIAAGGTKEELEQLADAAPEWQPAPEPQGESSGNHRKSAGSGGRQDSQATTLVSLVDAEGVELFHSPGSDPQGFATIPIDGHEETLRIRTKEFCNWLQRLFWNKTNRAANAQAIQDAVGVLHGKALFDGPERPVSVRLAEQDGAIWLDLANEDWQAVRIDEQGWQVVDRPPVRFIRPRGMRPLPLPDRGGSLQDLRQFINVGSDDDWLLIQAWLAAALRPEGSYPVLGIHGEQGSAKSTTCRMLRSLVDPNDADLRSEPRNEHDLVIAASNGWVIALENLSRVPGWLSDALCRLSTGGGFSTRELYTNDEEKIFSAKRPVLLNGIAEVAERSDLLDRSILINLPRIPDDARRTESELWRKFEAAKPRILGGLLDAVSKASANIDGVSLPCRPRMADFAEWGCAAAPALNCRPDEFLQAYLGNRRTANESAIESSIIAEPLLALMNGRDEWEGTATELMGLLENEADERLTKQRGWPKRPNLLSSELKRIAPNLRRMGIDIEFRKSGRRLIRIIRTGTQRSTPCVQPSEKQRPASSTVRPASSTSSPPNPSKTVLSGAVGALGAEMHDFSDDDWGEL